MITYEKSLNFPFQISRSNNSIGRKLSDPSGEKKGKDLNVERL